MFIIHLKVVVFKITSGSKDRFNLPFFTAPGYRSSWPQ